jgi:integrase/recombinase XerD
MRPLQEDPPVATDVDFSSHSAPNIASGEPSETGASPRSPDVVSLNQAPPNLSPHDPADFLLHPVEIEKGRRAAENYLSSFRSDESRAKAEEALETLATVISAGKCDSLEFPWQQVRSYHGAAALTILKEKGAPARVEALLCRRDSTRSYRMVPDAYPPRQVQKIRSTLTKLIQECCELGFVAEEATEVKPGRSKAAKTKTTKAPRKKAASGRSLSTGELRALMANCAAAKNADGLRDAVFFALVHCGLKIAEITALRVDSVGVSSKTGRCNIVIKPAGGGRSRRIELTNEELIYLEDWLDFRGSADGALLCTIGRAGKIEGKRLTIAALKQICEQRGQESEVQAFTPNDLSRSASDLVEHRKASRRKAAKSAEGSTAADEILFDRVHEEIERDRSEMILFPFLGLGV